VARRRIPLQAFGLKKYRGPTSPVSKICESEQTLAPLGQSEVLRIQGAPFDEPFRANRSAGIWPPASRCVKFGPNHVSNHASKIASALVAVEAGDVLDEKPSESAVLAGVANKSHCVEKEPGSRALAMVFQPPPLAGHAHILAREAADDQVDVTQTRNLLGRDLGHVTEVRDVRIMARQDRARKRLDFCNADTLPAERLPSHRSRFDSGK